MPRDILRQLMTEQSNARYALLLLTALNFFNYVDRNVLFAVQPLIQSEFKIDDAKMGFLTTAFFICYMVAAPLIAPLADRYPRKWIMAAGAVVWSLATLLSAVTNNYDELLLRHFSVGYVSGKNSRQDHGILLSVVTGGLGGRVCHGWLPGTPLWMAHAFSGRS